MAATDKASLRRDEDYAAYAALKDRVFAQLDTKEDGSPWDRFDAEDRLEEIWGERLDHGATILLATTYLEGLQR